MIIGMNGVFAAQFCPELLIGIIGDDFVGIHVGLRARASLPNNKREMAIEMALLHMDGGIDNGIGTLVVENIQVFIGECRTTFLQAERVDEMSRHCLACFLEREIVERALRLRTPVFISINCDSTQRIGFLPFLLAHDGVTGDFGL